MLVFSEQVVIVKAFPRPLPAFSEARILKHLSASPPLFQKALFKLTHVFVGFFIWF